MVTRGPLTFCPSSTDRSEVGLWIRRVWGVHRHGVQVRPHQTSHPVSFVNVTKITGVSIVSEIVSIFRHKLRCIQSKLKSYMQSKDTCALYSTTSREMKRYLGYALWSINTNEQFVITVILCSLWLVDIG